MDSKLKLKNVLKEPVMRGKPTIATILREHKLVEERDAVERQELERIMSGGMSPENYNYWLEKRREEEERQQREAMDQRKNELRLSHQKITERNNQKMEENRLRAHQFREQEMKLKQDLAEQNEQKIICARDNVDKIMLTEIMAQVAVANKLKEKKQVAQLVKEETTQIQEEGRRAKVKCDEERKDKIQKIQAASLVSHKIRELYNPYEIKEQGLNCELSDSEARFRIYLHKCDESAKVLDTKNRVEAEKKARREKIEEAKQKIAAYHELVKERRKYKLSPHLAPLWFRSCRSSVLSSRKFNVIRTVGALLTFTYVILIKKSTMKESSMQQFGLPCPTRLINGPKHKTH
ncbi:unnamed protein product [Allacma fusca]|uniref:Trichohyalin-plectin-homology domain-containing protein n=1 Tax=Allacma fusca TaxID=39272 RepID=A0A8J2PMT0_9HEXA|nr:unnamed protein product [Allacma fusca]